MSKLRVINRWFVLSLPLEVAFKGLVIISPSLAATLLPLLLILPPLLAPAVLLALALETLPLDVLEFVIALLLPAASSAMTLVRQVGHVAFTRNHSSTHYHKLAIRKISTS